VLQWPPGARDEQFVKDICYSRHSNNLHCERVIRRHHASYHSDA
jgi:hypothetical protein